MVIGTIIVAFAVAVAVTWANVAAENASSTIEIAKNFDISFIFFCF
jgi:hypothetical protein